MSCICLYMYINFMIHMYSVIHTYIYIYTWCTLCVHRYTYNYLYSFFHSCFVWMAHGFPQGWEWNAVGRGQIGGWVLIMGPLVDRQPKVQLYQKSCIFPSDCYDVLSLYLFCLSTTKKAGDQSLSVVLTNAHMLLLWHVQPSYPPVIKRTEGNPFAHWMEASSCSSCDDQRSKYSGF